MQRLAVFDLDGTITRHDTLVPYVLGFLARHPWRILRLPLMAPALARYAVKRDRGDLKSALIRAALGGVPRTALARWTAEFVPALLARGTFKPARQQIDAHRQAQHILVLMSASVDLYVPAVGAALGFSQTVCTQVRWNGDCLDGHLATPNRRGAEKVKCLQELRQRYPGLPTTAYGNAASDLPHLRLADEGVLVNGSGAARGQARRLSIRCLTWR